MKQSLISVSLNKFKSNPTSYIAVGLMSGLFLVLSMVFALIDPIFLFIAVPLLAMPFLFAGHVACYYLQINQPVTITAFFRYFIGFFRPQFRGSFRGLISFLKSLAFYFGGLVLSSLIVYLVFKATYGTLFTDSLKSLMNQYLYSMDATYEDIMMTLNENDGLLLTFTFYISAFSIPLAMLAFIYHISFSSLSIYYRTNVMVGAAPLMKMSVGNTYARNRHQMRKDWFLLNWPVLVISLLGMALFALLDIFVIRKIDLLPAFIIIGGVALLMFYMPLYFSNMETIYKKYENEFRRGNEDAINTILMRIQNSIDLSEEEKKLLEESLKGQKEEDKQE